MKKSKYMERQEITFESFCRKTICESASEIYRSIKFAEENEVPYEQALNLGSSQFDPASWMEEKRFYIYVREERFCIRSAQLANALQFLPPDKREVIVICFLDGKTDYQIAKELCICPGTVAYRKKQGLMILRNILEGECGKTN